MSIGTTDKNIYILIFIIMVISITLICLSTYVNVAYIGATINDNYELDPNSVLKPWAIGLSILCMILKLLLFLGARNKILFIPFIFTDLFTITYLTSKETPDPNDIRRKLSIVFSWMNIIICLLGTSVTSAYISIKGLNSFKELFKYDYILKLF